MSAWIVVLAAGVVTFATRLSFITLLSSAQVPDWFARALRHVPVAVLTAIVFPELLMRDGTLAIGADNSRLIAGAVAIALAWTTKKTLPTIAAGMFLLWGLEAIG